MEPIQIPMPGAMENWQPGQEQQVLISPQGLPSGNHYVFDDEPAYVLWLYGIVAFIVFTGSVCALKKLYSKIRGRNVKGDPNYRLRRGDNQSSAAYRSFN